MEDKAKKLRRTITLLLLLMGGMAFAMIVVLANREAPAPVQQAVQAPPAVAGKYVWDGKWNETKVPAGIGQMSDIIHQEVGTSTYLDTETRELYDVGCARQVPTDSGVIGYEHIECAHRTDVSWIYFINKTGEELTVRWHPGPIP